MCCKPCILTLALATFSLVLFSAGCDRSFPGVSGKVTVDGEPVPGVSVMFMPVSTEENPFPGPYAEAVTNDQGEFALITRRGSRGATPGRNIVEFYSVGKMEVEFMRSDALRLIKEANGDQNHESYQRGQELNQRADSLAAIASGSALEPDLRTEFVVPEGGTTEANFELTEIDKLEPGDESSEYE